MTIVRTTNFACASAVTLPRTRLALWIVFILISCLMLFEMFSAYTQTQQVEEMKTKLEKLEYENKRITQTLSLLPNDNSLRQVRDKVGVINELINIYGDTSVAVLYKLEAMLPSNVLIRYLEHKPKTGSVHLVIESDDTLALTSFVHNLEADDSFEQVLITRQSHPDNDSKHYQYDIRITQLGKEEL